jgi:iron(III) transport system permease protein
MSAVAEAPRRRLVLRPLSVVAAVAATAILFLLLYPLGRMLFALLFGDQSEHLADALAVFDEAWLLPVFLNTAVVVGVSTVLAVVLGATLAWVNERTDAGLGFVGSILPIVPLLIPNVALAIGWVFIGAPRVGFLNGLLKHLPAFLGPVQVNIYSWTGLILVYAVHGVPYVYLVVSAALRNLDPALEEASRTSGGGLLRTLRMVSGPAVAPALLAAGLLVAIIGVGIYSIPAVIATTARIDLLPTRIVQMLTRDFPPHMAEAQMLGALMLAAVAVLWLLQRRVARAGNFVTMTGRAAGSSRLGLGRWKWPARAFTIFFMLCTSVLPLLALLVVSLQPYWSPRINWGQLGFANFEHVLFFDHLTTVAFGNSLTLSLLGALIAMAIAVVIIIEGSQRHGLVTSLSDGAITASSAIPHLILALAFLIAFAGAPFNLAGTKTLLLLAFIVMYMPPGFIAANAAVAQVGKDLREASYMSGASESRTVGLIVLPLALPGLAAGFAIVFVHMMGDLSAAALLSGLGTPVIGFVIVTVWETGTFGLLAAFSAAMCAVNILAITAALSLGRLFGRR